MFIGSDRCISTTLRRSKRRLQAGRGKRLGRIADFLRLMTRAFKCSFSTTGNFEPIPLCSSRRARAQNGGRPLIQGVKTQKTTNKAQRCHKAKQFFSRSPAVCATNPRGGEVRH